MSDSGPVTNTDREIWRERPGDFYSPSIHVTREGGVGIDVGGTVFVMDVRDWHALAMKASDTDLRKLDELVEGITPANRHPEI